MLVWSTRTAVRCIRVQFGSMLANTLLNPFRILPFLGSKFGEHRFLTGNYSFAIAFSYKYNEIRGHRSGAVDGIFTATQLSSIEMPRRCWLYRDRLTARNVILFSFFFLFAASSRSDCSGVCLRFCVFLLFFYSSLATEPSVESRTPLTSTSC